MMSYIVSEWKKSNKISLFILGFFFLAFCSFIGLGIYFSSAFPVLPDQEKIPVLWGQLTFYYSQLFFPILLSLYVAMMLNQEFERKNIEFLRANNISVGRLLLAKEVVVLVVVLTLQFMLLLIFYVTTRLVRLDIPDFLLYLKWDVLVLVGTLGILAIQVYITSKTRVFSKSVGIGAVGTFIGFMLIFISDKLSMFYPYSQAMVSMRSRTLVDFTASEMFIFVLFNLLIYVIFHKCSVRELNKLT